MRTWETDADDVDEPFDEIAQLADAEVAGGRLEGRMSQDTDHMLEMEKSGDCKRLHRYHFVSDRWSEWPRRGREGERSLLQPRLACIPNF